MVTTTAKVLGNLSFLRKNNTMGLPSKAKTAAMAKYANTDWIL